MTMPSWTWTRRQLCDHSFNKDLWFLPELSPSPFRSDGQVVTMWLSLEQVALGWDRGQRGKHWFCLRLAFPSLKCTDPMRAPRFPGSHQGFNDLPTKLATIPNSLLFCCAHMPGSQPVSHHRIPQIKDNMSRLSREPASPLFDLRTMVERNLHGTGNKTPS